MSFEVNGLLLPNFECITWTIGEPSVESGDLEVAAIWSSTCSRLVGLPSISWIIISLLTKKSFGTESMSREGINDTNFSYYLSY
jgi:hypothetical protein